MNSIKCPKCPNVGLIDLSSMQMRVCGCCHTEYAWKLVDGKSVEIEKEIVKTLDIDQGNSVRY